MSSFGIFITHVISWSVENNASTFNVQSVSGYEKKSPELPPNMDLARYDILGKELSIFPF